MIKVGVEEKKAGKVVEAIKGVMFCKHRKWEVLASGFTSFRYT